jgi:oligoendopeptidase F
VEEFERLSEEIEEEVKKVEKETKTLDPEMSQEKFIRLMEKLEKLTEDLSRLGHLPGLMEAVDQKNTKAKLLKAKASDIGVEVGSKLRRIYHWLKGKEIKGSRVLDEVNAKRLFKGVKDLTYSLNYTRKGAKFTLSEEIEDVIANKDKNGINPLVDLREILETEMEFRVNIRGKRKLIKSQAELMKQVYSPRAEIREANYRALLGEYQSHKDKLFLIYQGVVKDWGYETKLRGYSKPISMRNFANQVSDESVERLLEVCRQNRDIFGRYFKYKAKLLGQKKIKRFDIYAPVENSETKIGFDKAKRMIDEAFEGFSPNFAAKARQIFEVGHIDSHPRPNKSNGAFCATVGPNIVPYILLNYTDTGKSMLTLAHELGHGVHSLYANQHSISSQRAVLPLAETASTLGELLVFEKNYQETQDKASKRAMLNDKLADAFATILRQNYFVLFEIEAHRAIAKGATINDLSQIYGELLTEQLGEAVEIDPIFNDEWLYISHLVRSPFYCYAYNFGELLSYALVNKLHQNKEIGVKTIEMILTAGGSDSPKAILKKAGVEIESKEFWQGSFEIIRQWQDELEKLG